jgi:hypothetical protein
MKRRHWSLALAFIGLLALGLLVIGRAQGDSALQQVSAARGGVVRSPSGGLTLAIPPGALEKDTVITVAELPPGEGPALGPTYDLGPTGLTFRQPVTITIHFDGGDVPTDSDPEDVAITEVNLPDKVPPASATPPRSQGAAKATPPAPAGSPEVAADPEPWQFLESEVDTAAGAVSAQIQHFSRYAARRYASFTLGSGPNAQKRLERFDWGWKKTYALMSGYAMANYLLKSGEFFMTVGAKVGEIGTANGSIIMAKEFRVKKGRHGETSSDTGFVRIGITHAAAYTGNVRGIAFSASLYSISSEPIGTARSLKKPYRGRFEPIGSARATIRKSPSDSGRPVVGTQPGYLLISTNDAPMAPGPSYQPGRIDFTIIGSHWRAGQWYELRVSLGTTVGANAGSKVFPPTGGEVKWQGAMGPGPCWVDTIMVGE